MKRMPALDGLRGVAILLVIAVHGWGFSGGALGVDLFFVLSGFLITDLLLAEHERVGRISLRGFYRRRAVRLLPALAVTLAAYFVFAGILVRSQIGDSLHRVSVAVAIGASYTTNVVSVVDGGAVASHLYPLWTLAEEEQFYLLWPAVVLGLLALGLGHRGIGYVAAGLAVASVLDGLLLTLDGSRWERIWVAPDTHASPILIGCAAGACWFTGTRIPARVGMPAAILAAVVLVSFSSRSAERVVWTLPTFSFMAALTLLSVAGNPGSVLGRLCSLGPLTYLGRISYGLYLWQSLVMRALRPLPVVGPVPAILLALLIAWASWRLLEQPLLRRFSRSSLDGSRARTAGAEAGAPPARDGRRRGHLGGVLALHGDPAESLSLP